MDLFLIREAIDKAGIDATVHVAKDGGAAIAFLEAAEADANSPCPDVVLLDLNLPKKTGAEVLKHLRENSRCRGTKVLIVSSSDAPRDLAAVEAFGVAGHFKKPSEYSEFLKLGAIVKGLL